jgi:multiple sugar transport system substrate-binding protein
MMFATKNWRAVVAVTAAALLLAACGSDDATDEPPPDPDATETDADADAAEDAADAGEEDGAATGDEVTVEYFTFSAAPDHLDTLQAIIDGFEMDNPGVTIEVQTAPFDDYFTRLQTRIAGGDAPDAFELNYENFVSFAAAGALLDPTAAAPDAIDPSVFYPEAFEAFSYDGVQYGLPASFSNVVLFYNKDLFDAAGLDYPDESWVWEDVQAAAEDLTDPDAGIWGVFQPVSFFEYFKVLAQNGGDFFGADGEVAFDSPEGVEAAEWLVGKVGEVMPSEADMGGQDDGGMFASGQLGMWYSGIWMFASLADADFAWDIAVEPGNVTRASHFFANGVVASATTDHPEETVRWLQYLAGSETTVESRLAASWELPPVAELDLLSPYLEQGSPDNREAVFASLESVVMPPVIERQQQMQDAIGQSLDRALLGQVSPAEAIAEAADAVQTLLP